MKFLALAAALALSVLSFLAFGAVAPRVAHALGAGFTEFPLTSGYDRPLEIITGPDHNLWFAEVTGPNIGTITPSGTITEYPIPNYSGFLGTGGIAAGSDGNLWVTDLSNNTVDKVTTGGTITPNASLSTSSADPEWITAGPTGTLWFTESNANFVGKITTAGAITEYAITANASATQIALGGDGALWFAEQSLDKIGHIKTDGTGYTEFSLSSGASPTGVVAGPDGNMWVTESGTGNIDKVSTAGVVLAQYPVSTSGASLQDITLGADGNMWFTEFGGDSIGKITTGGAITEYATGNSGGSPFGITSGPDGNMWYTEYHGDAIGRFATGQCATLADAPSANPVGEGVAETIGITVGSCGLATLNATTTTTTTSPSGCPAAPAIASFNSSLPYGQTDAHTAAFTAPSCEGVYTVNSTTKVGTTVMATASTTYQVLAVGDGTLFTTNSRPAFMAAGSDGNLWYTDFSNTLNRITPSGTITPFNVLPSGGAQITTGPDGNLYVANGLNGIAQVNITGCCGPRFGFQVLAAPQDDTVNDVTPGTDGNVWFTAGANGAGVVGFVTPASKFKQFKLPLGSGTPISIAAGSDNAMWFTLDSGQLGRITTAGGVTLFPVPGSLSLGGGGTAALGPDGNVWFLGADSNRNDVVARITPTGAVSEFATNENHEATGITTGADGNLWVNRPELGLCGFGGGVTRVTPSGGLTDFGAGCGDTNDRFNIVAGPDGNLWNAAYYGIGINVIEDAAPSTCTPMAAAANPTSVARGATESIAATIANCSSTPRLMKLSSKIIRPSNCGAAITTSTRVPLQPHVQTVVTDTFTAPSCKGTYTDKITLSSGGTVIASKSVTYKVT